MPSEPRSEKMALPPSSNSAEADGVSLPLEERYSVAANLAVKGHLVHARTLLEQLSKQAEDHSLRARIESDLATLAALDGDLCLAREKYATALRIDPDCMAARDNLSRLAIEEGSPGRVCDRDDSMSPRIRTKVAIVSVLFNWPSTGGGTIHTAETAKFLTLAGYEVRHFYAQFPEWGIGRMDQAPLAPSEAIEFDGDSWNAPEIQRRFRTAVDAFSPDFVIVTDSWNFKPLLAEAMQEYRYFLRLAALECLCPLNNVRLLVDDQGAIASCPRHQLATPEVCRKCVQDRERQSGSLHRGERALSAYGTSQYDQKLREAFARAEAVLVVNPLIAAMVGPYAKKVCVVPSGFDPERFPAPDIEVGKSNSTNSRVSLLFAGLTEEYMKGFHVLLAACELLWQRRRDFELVVTGDPTIQPAPFCRFIGWQTQEQLPRAIRDADVLVFPTIAEEALGRSAVEAMGAGRAVIASRIGGLQFTVTDEVTGLLFEPGNSDDLARKIERLLDSPDLCRNMGRAGRRKFESEFTWDVILDRHYRQFFGAPVRCIETQAN